MIFPQIQSDIHNLNLSSEIPKLKYFNVTCTVYGRMFSISAGKGSLNHTPEVENAKTTFIFQTMDSPRSPNLG